MNRENFLRRAMSRLLDRLEHVSDPAFPLAAFGDRAQAAVVLRFVFDDESAEKQDRNFQELIHDQLKDDENPAGASVTIKEWMDGFELVVRHAYANERIEIGGGIVRELFQVRHLAPKQVFAFRRGVNDLFGVRILQFGPGQIANAGTVLLDDVDELDGQVGGKER